ncbi:hypothetical protein LX64_02564 [Chitinophaga skermanii]|uniref:Uncharacterized protein n=2 Tax=Chitinophaga skermanii TaxID=331697 RepID=A0A327QL63_9BACT|nr:hypothetical protein LX64_02564 [Chitinophaga skermanii]
MLQLVKHTHYYRSLLAGLILLLFTVSQVPNQLLHAMCGNHDHTYVAHDLQEGIKITKDTVKCHCHHVVNQHHSPFIVQQSYTAHHYETVFSTIVHTYISVAEHSSPRYFFSIQGPPQA